MLAFIWALRLAGRNEHCSHNSAFSNLPPFSFAAVNCMLECRQCTGYNWPFFALFHGHISSTVSCIHVVWWRVLSIFGNPANTIKSSDKKTVQIPERSRFVVGFGLKMPKTHTHVFLFTRFGFSLDFKSSYIFFKSSLLLCSLHLVVVLTATALHALLAL